MLCHLGSVGRIGQTVVVAVLRFNLEKLHGRGEPPHGTVRIVLLMEHDLQVVVPVRPGGAQPVEAEILPENGDIVEAPGQQDGILAAEFLETGSRVLETLTVLYILLGDSGESGDPGGEDLVLLETAGGLETLTVLQPHRADLDDLKGKTGTKPQSKRRVGTQRLIPLHIQNDH